MPCGWRPLSREMPMYTIGPDNVELVWTAIAFLLLAMTAAALVMTFRRNELWWFVVVLLLPGLGATAYLLMRFGRARATSRAT
jgi:hypothetical protein